MKRQFTSILLFSALLLGGASTFVSCKDYESDVNYETNAKMDKSFAEYQKKLQDVTDALKEFKENYKKCNCDNEELLKEVDRRIEANKVVLDGYLKAGDVQKILTDGNYLTKNDLTTEQIKNLLTQDSEFKEALNASKAYQTIITNLYEKGGMSDSLKIAYDNALKSLNAIYDKDGNDRIMGLTDSVAKLQEKLEEVKAMSKDNQDRIQELADETSEALDAAIQEVIDMIPSDEHINDLTDAKLKDYYTKTQIDTKIEDILEVVNGLQESIWDILDKQVSGIIVQASESPLTGYENTPFGVQVGFLGAYYGNGSFTDFAGNPVAGNVVLDDANNAGTIYVTVNPANVKPENITLRLVDSQGNIIASSASTEEADQKAPFALEWANTNRILKFGVSKAVEPSTNGFYAVNVRLKNTAAAIAAAKTWASADKENLKAAAQNILDKLRHPKSSNLQLGQIASTLNSVLNNRLTAYGLEASWQQLDTNGDFLDKKVTSKLSLAATAVSPVSYSFLKEGIDLDLPTIPTLESKGLYVDTSKLDWKDLDEIEDLTQEVTVDVPDASTVTIDGKKVKIDAEGELAWAEGSNKDNINDLKGVNVTVSGVTFKANAVKWDTKEQTIKVTVSMAQFNDMIKQINSQVGNMIDYVSDLAGTVNGLVDRIDGTYIAGINNYIKKFEKLLTKSNSLLQPAMFYVAQNGSWGQLSKVATGATYLKLNGGVAQTVLAASSYTAELLAPAYQKQITVDGGAQITGTDANGVLKGNKYKVGFKATKPGTYKITYKAVDYFGNKETKEFYIKVVE